MEQFEGKSEQFSDYVHEDENSAYTRNLVATDNRTFALIVLCWKKGRGSGIHDHPGDGCWMSMLKGGLRETHYCKEEGCKQLKTLCVNNYAREEESGGVSCAYIDDSIAFHKVENASENETAVSLHLYSPPPSFCTVWDDELYAEKTRTGKSGQFHTRYGRKVDFAKSP